MTDAANSAVDAKGQIHLKLFGRTDVGQIREHNEDNFLIADLTQRSRAMREEDRSPAVGPRGNVFGVCDGMGGAAAGEVASQMAVDLIFETLASAPDPADRDDLARQLVWAVENAGQRIYEEARADRSRRGMGTTSTIAALMDECLFLAQVGDSRGYLLRGGQLVQVTRDQSLVNQLIEAGQLTEEEAETFEHNNIILQALGTSETVQVDLTYVELRQGDTLMMCSDGLSGMVKDAEIRQILNDISDPIAACKELTDRANAAGGHDNITVLIVKFEGDVLRPPDRSEPLVYRKYQLPSGAPATLDTPAASPSGARVESAPPSEEAANETRELRVSHTMFGTLRADQPLATARLRDDHRLAEEPVDLPTTGLAPQVVGVIVLLSLMVLFAVGVVLLR
jgi:PPM family protein phosphatase